MADREMSLRAVPAFANWQATVSPAVTIDVRDDLTIAGVAAFSGRTEEVAARLRERFGLALPIRPEQATGADGLVAQWAGPAQWLVMASRGGDRAGGPAGGARDLEAELAPLLGGIAAVVDLSDARAVLRVSGPKARDVLAKGVGIDLHARAFAVGDVAITHAAHTGVTIALVDDAPTFEISMFRSFAESFAHFLSEAAREFAHAAPAVRDVTGGRR